MAAMAKEQAYKEIKSHIDKNGLPYSSWYAGIASDPRKRLFQDHNVSEQNGRWIFRQCYNANDARTVEKWLHDLGCDGNPGGGDESTIYVYAYLKTPQTTE